VQLSFCTHNSMCISKSFTDDFWNSVHILDICTFWTTLNGIVNTAKKLGIDSRLRNELFPFCSTDWEVRPDYAYYCTEKYNKIYLIIVINNKYKYVVSFFSSIDVIDHRHWLSFRKLCRFSVQIFWVRIRVLYELIFRCIDCVI